MDSLQLLPRRTTNCHFLCTRENVQKTATRTPNNNEIAVPRPLRIPRQRPRARFDNTAIKIIQKRKKKIE
jgi:hypothetical protein